MEARNITPDLNHSVVHFISGSLYWN